MRFIDFLCREICLFSLSQVCSIVVVGIILHSVRYYSASILHDSQRSYRNVDCLDLSTGRMYVISSPLSQKGVTQFPEILEDVHSDVSSFFCSILTIFRVFIFIFFGNKVSGLASQVTLDPLEHAWSPGDLTCREG